jgi:hypothetical protein
VLGEDVASSRRLPESLYPENAAAAGHKSILLTYVCRELKAESGGRRRLDMAIVNDQGLGRDAAPPITRLPVVGRAHSAPIIAPPAAGTLHKGANVISREGQVATRPETG